MRAEEAFGDLLQQVDLLLPRTDEDGPDFEREHADVVSDLLAFLAERMTALHAERQAEMRAFFDWLEEQLGCPIEELSGKTYIRAYHEQEGGVDALLEVIRKNHPSKTALDVSAPRGYRATNPAREQVIEGYEQSMATLRPILMQIHLTDHLIDQIVYRLYALTDEEVALVEGPR